MTDAEIEDLANRVRVLERTVKDLRARVSDEQTASKNWVEEWSGSMNDIPEEVYDEVMQRGRDLVLGESSD